MSEEYEGRYVCRDGHIVKSKSERDIDNYLFDHEIRHVYEKELHTGDGTSIKPDFYLYDSDIYLEHWGFGKEKKGYTEIKDFKMDFYRTQSYTVICTYEKTDARNIEGVLDYKLNNRNIKKNTINFENPDI